MKKIPLIKVDGDQYVSAKHVKKVKVIPIRGTQTTGKIIFTTHDNQEFTIAEVLGIPEFLDSIFEVIG